MSIRHGEEDQIADEIYTRHGDQRVFEASGVRRKAFLCTCVPCRMDTEVTVIQYAGRHMSSNDMPWKL